MKEGPSGFEFRAKMAAGPFKGWYLAAGHRTVKEKTSKVKEPVVRPLKLVPDVKKATTFTYIEENYYVDHK